MTNAALSEPDASSLQDQGGKNTKELDTHERLSLKSTLNGVSQNDITVSRTKFNRSYVINYNHGKAMVAAFIECGTDSSAERWEKFETMLSTSMLPEDLEE